MLDMIKDLCSAITAKAEKQRIEYLKRHLSQDDLSTLRDWLSREAIEIDSVFVCVLSNVIDELLQQTSLNSTQQLFYLDRLILEILLGTSGHQLGEFEQMMLSQLGQIAEEDGIGPGYSTPRDVADLFKRVCNYRGCRLTEHGEYAAGIEHFQVTITLDPRFAPAYCNRARAYLELNRVTGARADCETMRSFDPGYPVGQEICRLVETLGQLKSQRKGTAAELAQEHGLLELLRTYDRPLSPKESVLKAGRQLNSLELPDDPGPKATADELNHLGVVRGRSGDYRGAINAFNRALLVQPDYLKAYFNRAKAYVLLEDYEKAVADFSTILRYQPQDTEAQQLLAEAQEQLKRQREAANQDKNAPASSDEDEPDATGSEDLLKRADELSRLWRGHEQALALLASLDEAQIEAYAQLPARRKMLQAAILARQGRAGEAIRAYSEALEMLSGTRSKALLFACLEGFARCLRAQGRKEDALACWQHVWQLSQAGSHVAIQERCCHELGQVEEELLHFEEALAWYQQAEELAQARENLGGVFAARSRQASLAGTLGRNDEQKRLAGVCRQMYEEFGEIVYLGPTALPRPEIVAQAKELLLAGKTDLPEGDLETNAQRLYDQATALRREEKKYEEAVNVYLDALRCYLALDRPYRLAWSLSGLGVAYQTMAEAALKQERHLFRERISNTVKESQTSTTLQGFLGILIGGSLQVYDLFYRRVGDLAEKARACHRWSLELHKDMDDLAGQADQLSNLANAEETVGNLDTAHRYQLWALQTHLSLNEKEDAAIDLINIAHIEECWGDVESGTARRAQAKELQNATKV